MNTILDYKTPDRPVRHLSLRTAAVGGVIAGAVTFGSVFLVGPVDYLGVGVLAGIVLSAMAARASVGFEFRAGFVASAIAAVTAVVVSIVCSPWLGGGAGGFDPLWSMLVLLIWWALFAVPGMLGSLWYWEGRRPRVWDDVPPAR